MQRRVMPDGNLEAFIIFLASLPAQRCLRLFIGASVILELLANDLAVCVDEFGTLIEQVLGGWYVARPRQFRDGFNL